MRVLCFLALGVALPAHAQVVLPGQKPAEAKEKPGNLAPHLVCVVCGERNYNTNNKKRTTPEKLEFSKYFSRCRKHTDHKETK